MSGDRSGNRRIFSDGGYPQCVNERDFAAFHYAMREQS